ncbi:MAG: Ig-like domain-containing protein, partial [Isosphaeraceae bacterium]|nr:Ig-like domain-containing protein [Isosphaeraceae bacterium]
MTCLLLAALAILPSSTASSDGLSVDPTQVRIIGSDGAAQIVVASGSNDLTHDAGTRYETSDPKIARVDQNGVVTPAGDGAAEIVVRSGSGTAKVRVTVEDFANRQPVHFASDVVPIFSKLGCNSGACHGKASGQNGFRLSLLGFDPRFDFDALVREARGRRVFPTSPRDSLVLLKPSATLPHGGGRRMERGSPEYRTIERWIAQGMPLDQGLSAPKLEQIEVSPGRRRMKHGQTQQLRVAARYSDGRVVDVTRLA